MSITWADVSTFAPEVASVPSARQTQILAMVDRQVNATAWGDAAVDGALHLAAHYGVMSLRGSSSAAGPVVSESVGPVSRSFAAPSSGGGGDGLEATSYGREYMRLSRTRAGAHFAVA